METVQQNVQDKTVGIIVHLLGLFTNWVGPLIVYLVKKDGGDTFTADNARESLNFQLTVLFLYIGCFFLSFIFIGLLLFWFVMLGNLVFCIVASIKTSNGIAYRYPMTIRLIK